SEKPTHVFGQKSLKPVLGHPFSSIGQSPRHVVDRQNAFASVCCARSAATEATTATSVRGGTRKDLPIVAQGSITVSGFDAPVKRSRAAALAPVTRVVRVICPPESSSCAVALAMRGTRSFWK